MPPKRKKHKRKKKLAALEPIKLNRVILTVKVQQHGESISTFVVELDQVGVNTQFEPGPDNVVVIPLQTIKSPLPPTDPPTQISNAQFAITITGTTGLFSTDVNFVSGVSANTDVVIVLQDPAPPTR